MPLSRGVRWSLCFIVWKIQWVHKAVIGNDLRKVIWLIAVLSSLVTSLLSLHSTLPLAFRGWIWIQASLHTGSIWENSLRESSFSYHPGFSLNGLGCLEFRPKKACFSWKNGISFSSWESRDFTVLGRGASKEHSNEPGHSEPPWGFGRNLTSANPAWGIPSRPCEINAWQIMFYLVL